MHRNFTEEETKMAHEHLKSCLVSFMVRESKATMRHLLPTSVGKQKSATPPRVGGDTEPQQLSRQEKELAPGSQVVTGRAGTRGG